MAHLQTAIYMHVVESQLLQLAARFVVFTSPFCTGHYLALWHSILVWFCLFSSVVSVFQQIDGTNSLFSINFRGEQKKNNKRAGAQQIFAYINAGNVSKLNRKSAWLRSVSRSCMCMRARLHVSLTLFLLCYQHNIMRVYRPVSVSVLVFVSSNVCP